MDNMDNTLETQLYKEFGQELADKMIGYIESGQSVDIAIQAVIDEDEKRDEQLRIATEADLRAYIDTNGDCDETI